jgi:hypothetical protein
LRFLAEVAQKKYIFLHRKEEACSQEKQRDMLELNLLDMQLRQLEQQSILAEQQIVEQQSLILSLDEFKSAKKGQEMLFPFSRLRTADTSSPASPILSGPVRMTHML